MDPNQQQPQNQMFSGPNMDPSNYDFITNPQKPPKKPFLGKLTANKTSLLIAVIGGGIGLIIFISLFAALFGGSSDRETLLRVARSQNSLIALAAVGTEKAGDVPAQSLASSVSLSTTSDQAAIISHISSTDGKVNAKDYSAGLDAKTSQDLTTAETNGRFDEAFLTAVQQALLSYQQSLQTANSDVQSKNAKALIAESFENSQILLATPSISQ